MLTFKQISDLVDRITYKPGWTVVCGQVAKDRPYVQIDVSTESDATIDATDPLGLRVPWRSAERYLSFHMCHQEVVGAVFGLIKDAEEHEMREWFRYRGASIFNPHLDPDVLVEVARNKASFNVRENAMSMEEPK